MYHIAKVSIQLIYRYMIQNPSCQLVHIAFCLSILPHSLLHIDWHPVTTPTHNILPVYPAPIHCYTYTGTLSPHLHITFCLSILPNSLLHIDWHTVTTPTHNIMPVYPAPFIATHRLASCHHTYT